MAITEDARMNLHRRRQEVLGPEEAATFMELVPPVGWADVATKRDLDHLEAATKRDLDHLEAATKRDLDHAASQLATKSELAELRGEMKDGFTAVQRDLRLQLLSIIAFNLTFFAGALALFER